MTQEKSIFETGDSLETLAAKAKVWFDNNSVEVPSGAKVWQAASVRKGEIPPGTGVSSLRRYGFNVTTFISHITGNSALVAYNYDPINASNCEPLLGLKWISFKVVKGHKRVLTECTCCGTEEEIDYGTLQRMRASSNKLCRYCRNAGGKVKELSTYDRFEGFSIVSRTDDLRFIFKCNTCDSNIERTATTVNMAEYLVCEHCFPERNFGARQYTDLGYFDSKIEYEAYKILLKYFLPEQIIRQKKYKELFNTGTAHTADFYIPSIPLVLEITSKYNHLGTKYKETAEWKLSLSEIVKFVYSLKEVEDIVQPLVKASEPVVGHGRSILCGCFVERP